MAKLRSTSHPEDVHNFIDYSRFYTHRTKGNLTGTTIQYEQNRKHLHNKKWEDSVEVGLVTSHTDNQLPHPFNDSNSSDCPNNNNYSIVSLVPSSTNVATTLCLPSIIELFW